MESPQAHLLLPPSWSDAWSYASPSKPTPSWCQRSPLRVSSKENKVEMLVRYDKATTYIHACKRTFGGMPIWVWRTESLGKMVVNSRKVNGPSAVSLNALETRHFITATWLSFVHARPHLDFCHSVSNVLLVAQYLVYFLHRHHGFIVL